MTTQTSGCPLWSCPCWTVCMMVSFFWDVCCGCLVACNWSIFLCILSSSCAVTLWVGKIPWTRCLCLDMDLICRTRLSLEKSGQPILQILGVNSRSRDRGGGLLQLSHTQEIHIQPYHPKFSFGDWSYQCQPQQPRLGERQRPQPRPEKQVGIVQHL